MLFLALYQCLMGKGSMIEDDSHIWFPRCKEVVKVGFQELGENLTKEQKANH